MVEAVYILCALTSAACAVLLLRGWRRNGVRLLFYSGLCFLWLALNNLLLLVDVLLVPGTDLALARSTTSLLGASTLLYGLIWDVS
ncbi:MAG TPA: DUF5985 family protein [Myxococcus sp.]|jgi:hypothetical protein|nr:DUF5985 family protein [Myxococcus sp.]